jgi:Fur family ferric uptake transcriptional regulator
VTNKDNCHNWTHVFERIGARITGPRCDILEMLDKAERPLSAHQIYSELHARNPKVGLATVYRTLSLLTEAEIVERLEFGDGRARYELAEHVTQEEHHHHLVCERCFRVVKYSEFPQEERDLVRKVAGSLEAKFGFTVERHQMHFYGLCPECRQRA